MVLLNKPMLSRMPSSSRAGITSPDQVVHLVAFPRGLLDALAGAGAHVQANQPGVHVRERNRCPAARRSGTEASAKQQKEDDEHPGVLEAQSQAPAGSLRACGRSRCAKPRWMREKTSLPVACSSP